MLELAEQALTGKDMPQRPRRVTDNPVQAFRHFVTQSWLLQRSDYFRIGDDPPGTGRVPHSSSMSALA